jgi:hypothetical protein
LHESFDTLPRCALSAFSTLLAVVMALTRSSLSARLSVVRWAAASAGVDVGLRAIKPYEGTVWAIVTAARRRHRLDERRGHDGGGRGHQ